MEWCRIVRALTWLPLCFALGCGGGESLRFPIVVLVAVDGVRADHLSASGYPRNTSPFLDALIERSVSFERAYAASSRSLTSQASLFTGEAPESHGLWEEDSRGLGDERTTLAERMAARGYATAAFLSTRRSWERTGLLQGFGHVDAPSSLFTRRYRRAGATVAAALDWVEERGEVAPLFLYVQLADPTKPLDPLPEPAARVMGEVPPDELIEFLVAKHRLRLAYFGYEHRHVLRLVNLYDAELRAADEALAALYGGMESGGGRSALWVVTATHGMGLRNHGWDGANRQIQETQVRVPLLVHTPGGQLAVGAKPEVVSHLRVADMLDALAGGSELAPEALLASEAGGVLVQRGVLGPLPQERNDLDRPEEDPLPEDAWVEARLKLLRNESGEERVYDVVDDPYETQDLASSTDEAQLERLRAALAAALSDAGR